MKSDIQSRLLVGFKNIRGGTKFGLTLLSSIQKNVNSKPCQTALWQPAEAAIFFCNELTQTLGEMRGLAHFSLIVQRCDYELDTMLGRIFLPQVGARPRMLSLGYQGFSFQSCLFSCPLCQHRNKEGGMC